MTFPEARAKLIEVEAELKALGNNDIAIGDTRYPGVAAARQAALRRYEQACQAYAETATWP